MLSWCTTYKQIALKILIYNLNMYSSEFVFPEKNSYKEKLRFQAIHHSPFNTQSGYHGPSLRFVIFLRVKTRSDFWWGTSEETLAAPGARITWLSPLQKTLDTNKSSRMVVVGLWVERGEMNIEVRGRLWKPASWVWVDAPTIGLNSKQEGFWPL